MQSKYLHGALKRCVFLVVLLLNLWASCDVVQGLGPHDHYPPIFNVLEHATISANASCGVGSREDFCSPKNAAKCDFCEAQYFDRQKRYDIHPILVSDDRTTRESRTWQSPTLDRGSRYEFVSITIDLNQVYQIESIELVAGNSPRPAAWILEKSLNGKDFEPWQYFTSSDNDCEKRYSKSAIDRYDRIDNDNEVICTSEYSASDPFVGGEMYIYFPNNRHGARNNSETYLQFTQTRYVRFSFQKIHRTIYTKKQKQLFYSLKSIKIRGRCVCSAHASRCLDTGHGYRQCQCERNTDGDMCEKCLPTFNQVAWQPGTSEGYQCEECNCHGHASSCMYDPAIDLQKLSLDTAGKRRGGGVCIGCSSNTTGINCERCKNGFYRPLGANATDSSPCKPCNHCDRMGSTGFCSSQQQSGKVGACECNRGYTGYNCDQCAPGYRGYPKCDPCPCNQQGMLPSSSCEDSCMCKEHVEGDLCDRCKPGYFGLSSLNSKGCLRCECSDATHDCHATKLEYESISTLESTWRLAYFNGTVSDHELSFEEWGLGLVSGSDSENYNKAAYWLAPSTYSGNRLSSYGTNLTYTVYWTLWRGDVSIVPFHAPNVVLISTHGLRIAYCAGRMIDSMEEKQTVPLLEESGWHHIRDGANNISQDNSSYIGPKVTRSEMLKVLANLKHLMIRSFYSKGQWESYLLNVSLPTGKQSITGENSLVEQCHCPEGYVGLSCEDCALGYMKIIFNGSNHDFLHQCIKCDCNGHGDACDLDQDQCFCKHNTVGPKCSECAYGYYGNATQGTAEDCKRCACPLFDDSNNFSPTCELEDPADPNGDYVCTKCPRGYRGKHCERCEVDWYGNPTELGGGCKPCTCNGGTCDPETGRCLRCKGNTGGSRCDRCKEAYYGDALKHNCQPCNCIVQGSSSNVCNPITGQCPCRALYTDRDCSSCIPGYGNVSAGCQKCDCGKGALSNTCDPITGDCDCAPGVVGSRCDQCDADRYDLTENGCTCKCKISRQSFWNAPPVKLHRPSSAGHSASHFLPVIGLLVFVLYAH